MRYCYVCQRDPPDSEDSRYCKECYELGKEEDDSDLVEYYEDRFMVIPGKMYPSIKASGNTNLCSKCKRPIYEVPLLLWSDDGELMTAFCTRCVEELRLFRLLGTPTA